MRDNAQIAGMALDAALAVILEKEAELAKIDAVAGDGDHGAGMARGLRAAVAAPREGTAGQIIARAGTEFSNAAGGASGALVGMFLMTLGNSLNAAPIDATALHNAFKSALATMVKLGGGTKVGDKTMIDTLDPFVNSFGEAAAGGASIPQAWQSALAAAERGMESTKDLMSRKGRSSKLRERSIGVHDAGAVSIYHILRVVGDVLQRECGQS